MSTRLILTLCASAAILSACATRQENPIYKYSTQYKSSNPYGTTTSPPDIAPVVYENTQTDANVSYASTATHNQAYTVPASTEQTRIVNKCTMSAGIETCHPVEIPVSAIQTAPAQTAQNGYLINASSVQNHGQLTQVDSDCLQGGAVVPCYPTEIPITTQATVSQPYYAEPEIIMANTGTASTSIATAPTDSNYGGILNGTPGYYAVHGTPDADVSAPYQADSYAFTQIETTQQTPNVVSATSLPSNHLFSDSYISGDGGMLHHIVEGDTVYSLARKTCTSVTEIKSLNGLNADSYIRLGDNIRLPASRC